MLDHEREICLNCKKYRCDNCLEWRDNIKPRPEIEQIDPKTGEVVAVFQSVADAIKYTDATKNTIYKALNNRGKLAGGYLWRKTEVVYEDV